MGNLKIFCNGIESAALQQIQALANYEAYKDSKIRIMPDAHAGIGCTIGTTMTITDKAVPNVVGVDIGCGMYTVDLGDVDLDGKITSGDARLALRASVKLEDYAPGSVRFLAADVDRNGEIKASDARTILRVSVKLESFS